MGIWVLTCDFRRDLIFLIRSANDGDLSLDRSLQVFYLVHEVTITRYKFTDSLATNRIGMI